MRSRSGLRLFEDIAENIGRIRRYARGYDAARFAGDEMCQDAVEHCLLRISEAARLLGDMADRHAPSIPWRDVRGIGNHLRHEYQKVNVNLIWRVVERDLTDLSSAVETAIATLRQERTDRDR